MTGDGRKRQDSVSIGYISWAACCISAGKGRISRMRVYAILKISPEGYAQFGAGLLQADKSVAARRPEFAPRAGADLPLLRPLPNVALRKIIVQRNLRPVEDQQQIVPLLMNPPQSLVQVARPLRRRSSRSKSRSKAALRCGVGVSR